MLTLLISAYILAANAASAPTGQTYAVVIGIADYQALTYATGDLRFADRDARQVAAFLQTKSGGSVPSSHIRLLTNRQATQTAIEQALRLFQKATVNDRVILYFSGHGMTNSFVPYDARPGQPDKLFTYQLIKSAFRAAKATTKLCIADACLSGGLTQQRAKRQTMAKDISDGSNVAMILASRSTQGAIEDQRLSGGAFTYYLLQGLKGRADLNTDGIVTIRELHRYVMPRVKQRTSGRQTPIFYGRFPDNLPLSYL